MKNIEKKCVKKLDNSKLKLNGTQESDTLEQNTKEKSETDNKKYPLYTEKIVLKPSKKYGKLIKCGWVCIFAILFGIIASVVMAVVYPMLDEEDANKKQEVTINKDLYPQEKETQTQEQSSQSTEITSASEDKYYEKLMEEMKKKSNEIRDSLVIIDTQDGQSAMVTDSKTQTQTVGVIINDQNDKYTIMTSVEPVRERDTIEVRVNELTNAIGKVVGYNEQTGIGIINVNKDDIPESVRNSMKVAVLGNSYEINQGDTILAGGKINGNLNATDSGMITKTEAVYVSDNGYTRLSTGISFSEYDYAFLFNIEGDVIGISDNSKGNSISAIGISDLKNTIEALINERDIPYAGIIGQTVTNAKSQYYGVPVGVYVTEVIVDSPAYLAGIQPGDVITKVMDNNILTIQSFNEKLYQYQDKANTIIIVKRQGKNGFTEQKFSIKIANIK